MESTRRSPQRSGSSSGEKRPQKSRSRSSSGSPARSRSSQRPAKILRRRSPTAATEEPALSAISFGLEFEFTLAFSEAELKDVMSSYGIEGMIEKYTKGLNHHRSHLRQDARCNNNRDLHPSWLVTLPQDKDQCQNLKLETVHTNFQARVCRHYVVEHLLLTRKTLMPVGGAEIRALIQPGNDVTLNGHPDVFLRSRSANYDGVWTLTNDHTLIGALETQLVRHLGDKMTPTIGSRDRDWDSAGVELISPRFFYANMDNSFLEIGRYLNSLRSGQSWSAFPSVWASTHLHIGFNAKHANEISILHLQHLAYILTLHEDLISKCHPRNHSGIPLKEKKRSPSPAIDYDSTPPDPEPRDVIDAENTKILRDEATYTGDENVASNRGWLEAQLGRLRGEAEPKDFANRLFDAYMDISKLVSLLQRPKNPVDDPRTPAMDRCREPDRHRGYMYNWNNLLALALEDADPNFETWKVPKPTIEFRQHAATLDVEEVRHWVEFQFAIVNFAQRRAEQTTKWQSDEALDESLSFPRKEESKYPPAEDLWPCPNIAALCQLVGLEQVEMDYWTGEFHKYANDRPSEEERAN